MVGFDYGVTINIKPFIQRSEVHALKRFKICEIDTLIDAINTYIYNAPIFKLYLPYVILGL